MLNTKPGFGPTTKGTAMRKATITAALMAATIALLGTNAYAQGFEALTGKVPRATVATQYLKHIAKNCNKVKGGVGICTSQAHANTANRLRGNAPDNCNSGYPPEFKAADNKMCNDTIKKTPKRYIFVADKPPVVDPTPAPAPTPDPAPAPAPTTNKCKDVDCPDNAYCVKKTGKCRCRRGYVKKNGKCVKKEAPEPTPEPTPEPAPDNPCDPNPCQNGSTCSAIDGKASCDCIGIWCGNTCSETCTTWSPISMGWYEVPKDPKDKGWLCRSKGGTEVKVVKDGEVWFERPSICICSGAKVKGDFVDHKDLEKLKPYIVTADSPACPPPSVICAPAASGDNDLWYIKLWRHACGIGWWWLLLLLLVAAVTYYEIKRNSDKEKEISRIKNGSRALGTQVADRDEKLQRCTCGVGEEHFKEVSGEDKLKGADPQAGVSTLIVDRKKDDPPRS